MLVCFMWKVFRVNQDVGVVIYEMLERLCHSDIKTKRANFQLLSHQSSCSLMSMCKCLECECTM